MYKHFRRIQVPFLPRFPSSIRSDCFGPGSVLSLAPAPHPSDPAMLPVPDHAVPVPPSSFPLRPHSLPRSGHTAPIRLHSLRSSYPDQPTRSASIPFCPTAPVPAIYSGSARSRHPLRSGSERPPGPVPFFPHPKATPDVVRYIYIILWDNIYNNGTGTSISNKNGHSSVSMPVSVSFVILCWDRINQPFSCCFCVKILHRN